LLLSEVSAIISSRFTIKAKLKMTQAQYSQRILYVTDGFSPFVVGGMQVVARRHVETLLDAGHEVISVSPDYGSGMQTNLPWPIITIPWPTRSLIQKLSPWRYIQDLERYSQEVSCIADEVVPDCVYAEGPLISDYLARPRSQRAFTIYHPHGMEMFQHKGSWLSDMKSSPLRSITRFHAQNSDIVVSLSRTGPLQRILRDRLRVSPERIYILPNCLSDDQMTIEAPRKAQNGHFLFIGRNEPRKGLPVLIGAFAGLQGMTLDLVGQINPRTKLPANVAVHGEISDRSRIQQIYQSSDFLVVPSFAEGMPIVILEAFAAGVPVIGADVGAVADLIRDGETGFLFDPGDQVGLRALLQRAVTLSPKDYERMSRNCLNLVRDEFSPSMVQSKLLSLFDRDILSEFAL
jgi:glycosyltransferase involved in cell wall biosynthesis